MYHDLWVWGEREGYQERTLLQWNLAQKRRIVSMCQKMETRQKRKENVNKDGHLRTYVSTNLLAANTIKWHLILYIPS